MTCYCNGRCKRYGGTKSYLYSGRITKYCKECRKYFFDYIRCPCCSQLLRTKILKPIIVMNKVRST